MMVEVTQEVREAAAEWLENAPPYLSMQEYAKSIRALSPAKIVGEG